MFRFINVMTAVLIVVLAVCIPIANASTIVFGEDGANQDLTGSSAGSSWSSSDEFIIAGDCYVPDDSTLTIGNGVTVKFDHNYGGDSTGYPEILVKGTLKCNGTSSNHVTFTNDSDTTRGLFKGLHLMGDSTTSYNYEGKLEGTYVDFYYGGADSGLVTVGERAILDLNHCIIRRSGFHGIYIYEEGSTVVLDTCQIDSSLESGISWSFNEDHNSILQVDGCTFLMNRRGDIVIPQPPPNPVPLSYVHGSTFHCWGPIRQWAGVIVIGVEDEELDFGIEGSIEGNYFIGQRFGGHPADENMPNKAGILILDGVVTLDQGFFDINNNVFAGVSTAIQIENLDFERQEGQETWTLSLDVYNNVFWACESGLWIDGYSHEAGPDWPEDNIILEYNLFGAGIGNFDIEFDDNQVDDPIVPAENAFKNDDRLSNCVYHNDCPIDELGDDWDLVNEVGNWPDGAWRPDYDSYDFHILKNSEENTLLNCGPVDFRLDPDGSPADMGCYGGHRANLGIGAANSHPGGVNVNNHQYDQPFYVKIMGGNWQANSNILNNVYYVYQDFTVPANFTYTMSAGTWIITKDSGIDFTVNGTLDANGTEADPIVFADGTNADGFGGDTWEGIEFTSTATTTSQLDWVKICGVDNNSAAIHIDQVTGENDWLEINNCRIYQNGDLGIWIEVNSEVKINGCQIDNNGSDGIYIDDSDATEIDIDNVNVHHNGESGLNLHDAIPDIDNLDGNSVSRFNLNTLYGMELDGSDPNLNDATNHGHTEFKENTDSAVWLTIDSSPSIINGYNDYEPDGQLAIEYAADPDPAIIGAWRNWWGTDSPTDALFNYPDNVSYEFYPNDEENVDNLSSFEIAKRTFDSGDYEESIALFERAVFDRENYIERFAALRYLKGAYKQAGRDFEDLRTFYARAANRIEEPRIAFEAGRQNALTLKLTGEYEELIDLLTTRRRILENRADSLRNEMDLVKVVNLLERRSNRMNGIDSDKDYRAEYDNLMDLWNDALDNGDEGTIVLPHSVEITDVYPNPFNNSTTICYSLNKDLKVEVAIYNACGQQVDVLHSGQQKAGIYSHNWTADDVSSGVYFIRLNTREMTVTRKTLLIR